MKHFVLILFSFLITELKAQWLVEYDILPLEEYVTNHLLEPGALVSNIQFTGSEEQLILGTNLQNYGYGLPFNSGVVISDTWAQAAVDVEFEPELDISAYTPPAFSGPFDENDGGIYNDLIDIANLAGSILTTMNEESEPIYNTEAFDVAMLEFDVVPTTDFLSFNYSLSGGEFSRSMSCYPNPYGYSYASCEYEDVFAIFVSGPGLNGPYSAPGGFPDGSINAAVLPGSNPELPLVSKSINDSTNVDYFINFCDGSMNQECFGLLYTQVITNEVPVVCGQTYHIRIAIADIYDHIYSWHSFLGTIGGTGNAGNNPQISISYQPGTAVEYDAFEDCNPVYLNVQRSVYSDLATTDTLLISMSGSASMNLDYSFIPDTIFIPPGDMQLNWQIDIFNDGIIEGTEDLVITCQELHNDDQSCSVYFPLEIHDSAIPLLVTGFTMPLCDADEVELEPLIYGGYGQYEFEWFDNSSTESITLIDPIPGNAYYVIIKDTCGLQPDTAWFELFAVDPPQFSFDVDSIAYGCNTQITLVANVTGGYGDLHYAWTPLAADDPDYTYPTFFGPSTVVLEVSDECNNTAIDSVVIYLDDGLPLQNLIATTAYTGCDNTVELFSLPSGGFFPYTYWWVSSFGFEMGQENAFTVDTNTIVTAWIFDNCSQFVMTDVEIIPGPPPLFVELPDDLMGSCLDTFMIVPEVNGGEGILTYQWDNDGNTVSTETVLEIENLLTTTDYQLSVWDECLQLVSDTISVNIENASIGVTLPADTSINCAFDLTVDAMANGGNGSIVYQWFVNDILMSNNSDHFFSESDVGSTISVVITDECGYTAGDEINIEVTSIELNVADTSYAWCDPGAYEISIPVAGGNGTLLFDWGSQITSEPIATIEVPDDDIVELHITDECMQSDTAFIELMLTPATSIIETNSTADLYFQFNADSSQCENCDYAWETGGMEFDGTYLEYFATGENAIEVWLIVSNDAGCRDSSFFVIPVTATVYIPNSFTPDNDGVNDTWGITATGFVKTEIQVFNRWGEVIFESTDPQSHWMGNVKGGEYYASGDVYIYRVQLTTSENEIIERSGTITLVR